MNAQEAIARSISHNEIVHISTDDHDEKELTVIMCDLEAACDDSVDCGDHDEFWGVADGNEWRVHVD